MARKLSVSAPREISAQTGRLASFGELLCMPAMALPKSSVYAIRPSGADRRFRCRENDNPTSTASKGPLAFARGHRPRAAFWQPQVELLEATSAAFSGPASARRPASVRPALGNYRQFCAALE